MYTNRFFDCQPSVVGAASTPLAFCRFRLLKCSSFTATGKCAPTRRQRQRAPLRSNSWEGAPPTTRSAAIRHVKHEGASERERDEGRLSRSQRPRLLPSYPRRDGCLSCFTRLLIVCSQVRRALRSVQLCAPLQWTGAQLHVVHSGDGADRPTGHLPCRHRRTESTSAQQRISPSLFQLG